MPSTTVSSNTISPEATHGPTFSANSLNRCMYLFTVKPCRVRPRVMACHMLSGPGARSVALYELIAPHRARRPPSFIRSSAASR